MTRLSVNINKVALIRNSREGNYPDLYKIAEDCETFGAEGITVHPRPDERHIRYSDIPILKKLVKTEYNIEGYPSRKFIDLVVKNNPDQVTLVPDPPDALTSNTGWNTKQNLHFLKDIVAEFHATGIRVSLFLNAEPEMLESAKRTGAERIELYTGTFAKEYLKNKLDAVQSHYETSKLANSMNIGLNAGHDLNLQNLAFYKKNVVALKEVSIGHALIVDSMIYGLKNTIQMYLKQLQ